MLLAAALANCKFVLKKNGFNCEKNLLHRNAIEQYLLLIIMLILNHADRVPLGNGVH